MSPDIRKTLKELYEGYSRFREKYATHENTLMQDLHLLGQKPKAIIVSCCDSRVDPALLLQCDPGDLFVIRNIANIVPPYENDYLHHGTSAALEFGINILKIKHLIILGHSQCGGIKALIDTLKEHKQNKDLNSPLLPKTPFVNNWVSIINIPEQIEYNVDECAKLALLDSYKNSLSFPWIKEKVSRHQLMIHLWFFEIKTGEILSYDYKLKTYIKLPS